MPADDLVARVASRKSELVSEIIEHKKNSSRWGAVEAIDRIQRHLAELPRIMNGNERKVLSDDTRSRLVEWIAR